MRTFVQKQKPRQQIKFHGLKTYGRPFSAQNPTVRSILHLQRTIGNQAVLRLLRSKTEDLKANSANSRVSTKLPHDFSRLPVHASVQSSIQPNRKVSTPGGTAEPGTYKVTSHIEPGNNLGKPLDTGVKEEMKRKIGFDFSNVRIHTDDLAIYMNKGLNARAFTHGSDIYFNEGEYSPNSLSGHKLLVHELTHVVQQSLMPGKTGQRDMIQCTTIGQILDTFFSPFSKEKLWVMPESDNYTKIVRKWQPVINAVNKAKADLEANCVNWKANHKTNTSWKPGKTDPPVADLNAYDEKPAKYNGIWVPSPPGTDPKTCAKAFIIYVTTKAKPSTPTIQTFELYTCSIGSFGIYATVDSIDCAAKTAKMNIWMYNAMDEDSFGRFAKYFPFSGMKRQYMWWNWSETHSWSSSSKAGGGGSKGGAGGW